MFENLHAYVLVFLDAQGEDEVPFVDVLVLNVVLEVGASFVYVVMPFDDEYQTNVYEEAELCVDA